MSNEATDLKHLRPKPHPDQHNNVYVKDASLVKRYGIRLLPELYAHLNPMQFETAAQMEKDLAEDLR